MPSELIVNDCKMLLGSETMKGEYKFSLGAAVFSSLDGDWKSSFKFRTKVFSGFELLSR